MAVERHLDFVEEKWRDKYFALSLRYRGQIKQEQMKTAYESLFSRYAIMRSIIVNEGDRAILRLPENHFPEYTFLHGGSDLLRSELRYQTRSPNGLSRLIIVQDETGGHIALQQNHAVFDGPSTQHLIRELWRAYTRIISGHKISFLKKSKLTQPPSNFMLGVWNATDRMILELDAQTASPLPEYHTPMTIHRTTRLPATATANLISASRKHKVSLHGMICGALLKSFSAARESSGAEIMTCYSQVDFRNRVTPPIGPVDTALVDFKHRVDIAVGPESTSLELAKEVKKSLQQELRRRTTNSSAETALLAENAQTSPRERTLQVGNAGLITHFQTPPDLEILELTLLSEVAVNDTIPINHADFTAFTFGDRLSIDVRFPCDIFSEGDARKIEDAYVHELANAHRYLTT
ncbi:hypothetical protein CU254_12830 [Amycolatopsis sp. AA4]|uniref:phthiocerol/phthiodiolone dimycocerosyl transferase family protein n=1 Tax=Actinomycetes TaxID=1760 RepID=UPI000995E57B|nr:MULTISPECIES: hypothetical protein [Actinomycetes]ATY11251.1 hypothetical protein CU254_12830 [Amycolatopsis sp. AA4]